MSKNFSNETEFLWDDQEEMSYTTVDNYICNNNNIEFNTQGIYLQIVKFKNSTTHKVYMSGLEKTGKGSKRDIQRGILNLRMEGFLIREVIREKGRFQGYAYKIRRKPLELSIEDKIAIYTESKVNKEYTTKVYGKEFAAFLDKEIAKTEQLQITESSSIPCKSLISTESTNCDIGNCDIGNCAPKKENKVKSKLYKKENKSSSSVPSEKIEDDEQLMEVISLYKECINKNVSSKLKQSLKELISTYGKDHVLLSIRITMDKASSPNLAYLKKVCSSDTSAALAMPAKPTSKNPHFTTTYSHNWDFKELEKREREYIEKIYG